MKKNEYPVLNINLSNIMNNAQKIVELCNQSGISVSGVIKGAEGDLAVAEQLVKGGCQHIASSRIEQLADVKERFEGYSTMLLRLPMFSELSEVVRYADISLNSELSTLMELEQECKSQNKTHQVVLMMDLGDLREGFMDIEELIEAAVYVEAHMEHVKLAGIGTNLGCYGSVKPTIENMTRLAAAAEAIEGKIGRKLDIVSGGATTSLPLLIKGKMPKKINNLRIGEGILDNMDLPLLWHMEIPGMKQDNFVLEAQLIEVKDKPSHPIGELFVDAFGHVPQYEDIGIRKRALAAIGMQDFAMYDKLIPVDGDIHVVGSSSDHLILDITDCKREYKLGDVVSFQMFYGPMLFLCSSRYVRKNYL